MKKLSTSEEDKTAYLSIESSSSLIVKKAASTTKVSSIFVSYLNGDETQITLAMLYTEITKFQRLVLYFIVKDSSLDADNA